MKTGRPRLPKGEAKDSTVIVRLTDTERARAEKAADGKSLSDWVRAQLFKDAPSVLVYGGIRVETPASLTMAEWEFLRKYLDVIRPAGEREGG